jgi:alkylmercury lyase-like protein
MPPPVGRTWPAAATSLLSPPKGRFSLAPGRTTVQGLRTTCEKRHRRFVRTVGCHDAHVDPADLELRRHTYAQFVELGRAPDAQETAQRVGMSVATLLAGWRRLHDAHALVLDDAMAAIRMANPFSAVPTVHRVAAGGRSWFANCAWDAFGICAALQVDGSITTACPDCGDELSVEMRDGQPLDGDDLVFHCLVPAAHWWDDIVFT